MEELKVDRIACNIGMRFPNYEYAEAALKAIEVDPPF